MSSNSSSSCRSAFDILLSNSKNKQHHQTTKSSSPNNRKRKVVVAKQQNPNPFFPLSNSKDKEEQDDLNEAALVSNNFIKKAKSITFIITPDKSVEELKRKAATFDVNKAAYWGKGERVPFMFVAKAIDAISSTTSGRVEILCNVLRTVIDTTPGDLLPLLYLLSSDKIGDGLDLGIGDGLIVKAIAEACGKTEAHITKQSKVASCNIVRE